MKFNFYILLASFTLLILEGADAQVGIGTTTPYSTAALDITSTTKGILIPRMTSAQRQAISSPANGLMVYQTDETVGYWYYNGSIWTTFTKNNIVRITEWGLTSVGPTDKRLDSFKLVPNQCAEIIWKNRIDGGENYYRALQFSILNLSTDQYYESVAREIYSYSSGAVSGTGNILIKNIGNTEREYVLFLSKNSLQTTSASAQFQIKTF